VVKEINILSLLGRHFAQKGEEIDMRTKSLLAIAALLCILLVGCDRKSQSQQMIDPSIRAKSDIENADFALVNSEIKNIISLNGDARKLDKKLGKTEPVVLYENSSDPEYSIMQYTWESLDLKYIVGNGTITSIVCNSATYKTPRGVGVGDAVSSIFKMYPSEIAHKINGKIEYDLGNAEMEAMMALIFYNDGKRITKIEIMEGD